MNKNLRKITFAAAIAAIYVVLTLMPGLSILSFGAIQFRVSEALTIMPLFSPYGIVGITLGCFISNIFSSASPYDIIFGTLATLIAAYSTYKLRNKNRIIALLPPILFNGIIVGIMIALSSTESNVTFWYLAFTNMVTVAIGEAGVCYLLGLPLSKLLDKHKFDI